MNLYGLPVLISEHATSLKTHVELMYSRRRRRKRWSVRVTQSVEPAICMMNMDLLRLPGQPSRGYVYVMHPALAAKLEEN